MKKLQAFINKCLRRILQVVWSDRVSNIELSMAEIKANFSGGSCLYKEMEIARSHPSFTITRQALTWNPQGR